MGEDILLQAEEAYKAMEKEAAEATATMQKDADKAQAGRKSESRTPRQKQRSTYSRLNSST